MTPFLFERSGVHIVCTSACRPAHQTKERQPPFRPPPFSAQRNRPRFPAIPRGPVSTLWAMPDSDILAPAVETLGGGMGHRNLLYCRGCQDGLSASSSESRHPEHMRYALLVVQESTSWQLLKMSSGTADRFFRPSCRHAILEPVRILGDYSL